MLCYNFMSLRIKENVGGTMTPQYEPIWKMQWKGHLHLKSPGLCCNGYEPWKSQSSGIQCSSGLILTRSLSQSFTYSKSSNILGYLCGKY